MLSKSGINDFVCVFVFSQGLTFPPDAGFPFDSSKERFYMMTTHYRFATVVKDLTDSEATETPATLPLLDNSGLRIFVTPNLRNHDAGVLSIGKFPKKSIHSEWYCNNNKSKHNSSTADIPFNNQFRMPTSSKSKPLDDTFSLSIQFAFGLSSLGHKLMANAKLTYSLLCI